MIIYPIRSILTKPFYLKANTSDISFFRLRSSQPNAQNRSEKRLNMIYDYRAEAGVRLWFRNTACPTQELIYAKYKPRYWGSLRLGSVGRVAHNLIISTACSPSHAHKAFI
ncbi:hypothetical protein EVAR_79727_1 [Eumeta japonica]|uniref:Uncharacterized protein n=1 Tax=Eumeta variegata TaxID=151549 RepID=A0A4C1TCL7_EUMVA|nr:hypothetical protein EVAR_79727_1 [Eumeta japonica]